MIHPVTQLVVDHPRTVGLRAALAFFDWQRLDKYEEVRVAPELLRLAQIIDAELSESGDGL